MSVAQSESNAANRDLAVQTRGVTKTFGRGDNAVRALKGVDFEASCGELIMIVGPSGCGKTTFLSVICGTMKADAGSVDVFGTDLVNLGGGKLTDFRGRNVGFIFQQFNLIPTWNILENTSIPLLLQGQGRRKAQDAAAKLLTEVGLGDRLGAHPQQLSGGQQQRVAIARALVHGRDCSSATSLPPRSTLRRVTRCSSCSRPVRAAKIARSSSSHTTAASLDSPIASRRWKTAS